MEAALYGFRTRLVEFLDEFTAFCWGWSFIELFFAPAQGVARESKIDVLGKTLDGSEDLGKGGSSLEDTCGAEAWC